MFTVRGKAVMLYDVCFPPTLQKKRAKPDMLGFLVSSHTLSHVVSIPSPSQVQYGADVWGLSHHFSRFTPHLHGRSPLSSQFGETLKSVSQDSRGVVEDQRYVSCQNAEQCFPLPPFSAVSLMIFPCQSSQHDRGKFRMSAVTKGRRGEY